MIRKYIELKNEEKYNLENYALVDDALSDKIKLLESHYRMITHGDIENDSKQNLE